MNGMRKLTEFVACAAALGVDAPSKARILWRETKNLRTRLGLARHHPELIFTLDTTYGRLHFRDNFGDITNLPNLLWREVYRLPRPIGTGAILDVGANIGLAAVWFHHHAPASAIHCFEPLEDNTRLVRLNCPDAVVNTVAVGAQPGLVQLGVDRDSVMATSIDTPWDTQARSLPVVTLDDYAEERGIERVAVLKVDTEGMELEVLGGARATLARTGQVAMETHSRDRHDASMAMLRDAGLLIAREEFDGHTGMVFAVRDAPLDDR